MPRLTHLEYHNYLRNIDDFKEINSEHFEKLKGSWCNSDLKKKYEKFKKMLRDEKHTVNGHSVSGKYFQQLLNKKTQLTSEIKTEIIDAKNVYSKKYFSTIEKLGINCKFHKYFYLGAPLFATERYSGILRIIIDENLNILTNKVNPQLVEKYFERINFFSQIISLNLKTNFYLGCFSALSKLQIDLNENLTIDSEELDNVCEKISNLLNCSGCLMRIIDSSNLQGSPIIKGISPSLDKYKLYTQNLEKKNASFSPDIVRVFSTQKHNKAKIQAITFSLLKSEGDAFQTIEYFYSKSGKLRSKNIPERRFRDFTADYKKVLSELLMIHITVVPLKHFDKSFFVFSNSKNREFTISDIEIMLLASQRIGLEIKHTQETKRRNKEELHEEIQGN